MSEISQWSTTAASNNSAAPDGISDNTNAASVDDWGRETMASVRKLAEDAQWFDWGHTPLLISATVTAAVTFSISTGTDVTAEYAAGRRIKMYGTTMGTKYANIVSSSYTTLNTITVNMDTPSGTATSNLSRVYLGIITPANNALPSTTIISASAVVAGTVSATGIINTDADYRIGGVQTLAGNALGANVVISSLTGLGTLTALNVGGNASVSGTTGLTGAVDMNSNADVAGNFSVSGTTVLTGAVDMNANADVAGNFSVSGATVLTGAVSLKGAFSASGAAVITGGISTPAGISASATVVATGGLKTDGTNTLKWKVMDIGDWDMDTAGSVNVAHGLTLSKIRAVSIAIRNDADDTVYLGDGSPANGAETDKEVFVDIINATNVVLERRGSGLFDAVAFDQTTYNRGWITITHIA